MARTTRSSEARYSEATSSDEDVSQGKKKRATRTPEYKARADKIVIEIINEIDNLPINPITGKAFRGAAKVIIDQCLEMHHWLTRDMIMSRRKRMHQAKESDKATAKAIAEVEAAAVRKAQRNQKIPLHKLTPVKKGGRKKGSTDLAMRQMKRKFNDMKNDIVRTWVDKTKRPSNCTMKEFIERKKKHYGFDTGKREHQVTTSMIKSRMRRDQIENEGRGGQRSPLFSIEPRLVMFLKLASDCNQEMTEQEILCFVNTYIEGSKLEQEIIDWKIRNHADWRNDYISTNIRPERADIQSAWFRGFISRWNDEICYSKSKNTAHYRKEHCTYAAFDLMYEKVYGLLEQGGYATKLPSPLFYNQQGVRCDESDAFGLPVNYDFKRPDLVFCADECGTNTNMSNDRLSGGNKRVHRRGTKVLLPGCTSDTHFTTMGFTSLDGRPVLCVVIIQKQGKLNQAERFGFDVEAEWNGDLSKFDEIKAAIDTSSKVNNETQNVRDKSKKRSKKLEIPTVPLSLLEANMGPGHPFPGGPECYFNGRKIPSFVTSSESGGITNEILVEILQHLDKHGVSNRVVGEPPPCLIVDGHGSRLSVPFLRYVNNLDENGDVVEGANHRWNVYIGLPNGTAFWQVADSSYINGRFKLQMRRQKETVRATQQRNREALQIKRHHVVPMIRNCWATCFGDVNGNKKAILERGWNPLNKGCLVMPDIAKTKRKDPPKYNDLMERIERKRSGKPIDSPERTSRNDVSKTDFVCAAGELCGMDDSPFTDQDTHRCKTCGKRVHGILCCVEQTEDEEGTGRMYCKQCGHPDEDYIEASQQSQQSQQSQLSQLSYRSEEMEERLSQDPDHCKDMNPSGLAVHTVISKFQHSDRRNIGIEKKALELQKKIREQRGKNELMGFLTTRCTAGALASVGVHDISRPGLLELMEAKEEKKQAVVQSRIDKIYDKDMKIFRDGIHALTKLRNYEATVRSLSDITDKKEHLSVTREAKRSKKWMLNEDYTALIKYKKLGLNETLRKEALPPTLAERKDEWYSKYEGMPEPEEPTKPTRYKANDSSVNSNIADDIEGDPVDI